MGYIINKICLFVALSNGKILRVTNRKYFEISVIISSYITMRCYSKGFVL